MWSPNELLKTEKQRDILSYITLQFFPFKKVPLEHYPNWKQLFYFDGEIIRSKQITCPASSPREHNSCTPDRS